MVMRSRKSSWVALQPESRMKILEVEPRLGKHVKLSMPSRALSVWSILSRPHGSSPRMFCTKRVAEGFITKSDGMSSVLFVKLSVSTDTEILPSSLFSKKSLMPARCVLATTPTLCGITFGYPSQRLLM